jgi:hypothetical protein
VRVLRCSGALTHSSPPFLHIDIHPITLRPQVEARRKHFGSNYVEPEPPESIWCDSTLLPPLLVSSYSFPATRATTCGMTTDEKK